MLRLLSRPARPCDGMPRRDFLRVGALGTFGLALPQLLQVEAAAQAAPQGRRPRATACILFYLQGGQSQVETFDMKPAAPEEIRGDFKPIRTRVPGTLVCEHLPRLARLTHRYALVRSMAHHLSNHNPAGYYTLTGEVPVSGDAFDVRPRPGDFPNIGAVAARHRPSPRAVPAFVQMAPAVVGDLAIPMPGQGAGVLGGRFEPLKVT